MILWGFAVLGSGTDDENVFELCIHSMHHVRMQR